MTSFLDAVHYSFNPYAIPMAFAASAVLGLGLTLLIAESRSAIHVWFCVMALTIGLWLTAFALLYCAVDAGTGLRWAKLAYVGVACMPSAIYQFTIAVLHPRSGGSLRLARISWLLSAVFLIAIINTDWLVRGLYRYWWGYYPQYGWLSLPYLAFFFGMMVVSLRRFWIAASQAEPGTPYQHRVQALLRAFIIVYLGSFDYVAKYGIPLYPFGYVPVLVFVALVARVVWRYRLVDITPAFAAKQIIGTMAGALLVFDREGIVRVVNQSACRFFGASEQELVGMSFAELARRFVAPLTFEEVIRKGRLQDYELTLHPAADGGAPRTLSLSTSLLEDRAKQPIGLVCVAVDITKRTAVEEALRKTTHKLQRSNGLLVTHRARLLEALADLRQAHEQLQATQLQLIRAAKLESVGRLAAGVAHEVKNPLAILQLGVNYLAHYLKAPDSQANIVFGDMKYAVRRADAIIKGLLDFSSPNVLRFAPEDVNAVVERALELVKHECARSHIAVAKRLSLEAPRLKLDRDKMEQVFVNVFLNAVHAMPNGGTLTVTTSAAPAERGPVPSRDGSGEPAQAAVVEIEDTGTGIPADVLPKLFEPFFTTKPPGEGTGLGLAVTKTIVELHRGAIDVQNRPEGGVRVVVTLPVDPQAVPARPSGRMERGWRAALGPPPVGRPEEGHRSL